jgi:predicted ATPase
MTVRRRLFRRRPARFTLISQNAEAVAELCRRLDGPPLALELCRRGDGLLTPAEMGQAG